MIFKNLNKLKRIHEDYLCKKYYLLSLTYLFIYFSYIYFNIEVSYFIFLFSLEKIIISEMLLFFILNGTLIIIYHKVINNWLIKSYFFYILMKGKSLM